MGEILPLTTLQPLTGADEGFIILLYFMFSEVSLSGKCANTHTADLLPLFALCRANTAC